MRELEFQREKRLWKGKEREVALDALDERDEGCPLDRSCSFHQASQQQHDLGASVGVGLGTSECVYSSLVLGWPWRLDEGGAMRVCAAVVVCGPVDPRGWFRDVALLRVS